MPKRLNICGGANDKHARYTMDELITKVESGGNGIKTVIVNLADVSRELNVPPTYPIKYFGIDLGTQIEDKNDKYLIKGKFSTQDLQTSLFNFIKKFILCPKCKLPETVMSVKGDSVQLDCNACSHHHTIPPIEKLCKYIVAHPPPKRKLMKQQTKQQQIEQEDDMTRPSTNGHSTRDNEDDDEEEDDDVQWSTDVSEEAVKKRQQVEANSLANIDIQDIKAKDSKKKTLTKPTAAVVVEPVQQTEEEVSQESPVQVLQRALNKMTSPTNEQILQAMNKVKADYELSDKDTICLMFEALFAISDSTISDKDLMVKLNKYMTLVKQVVKTKKDTKFEQQVLLLSYIEDYVAVQCPEQVNKLAKILEVLYDKEVLTEPAIVQWHAKKKSKFIKSADVVQKVKTVAKPFVDWLQTAEEEDEDNE